jgi:hypothetical protein
MRAACLSCMVIMLFFTTCRDKDNYLNTKGVTTGFIPVYSDTFGGLRDSIVSVDPEPVIQSGKIYLYDKWLFINEQARGVHVFDNSNPASPVPVCFIRIPGNYDISCKDSTMYAQSGFGLIHLNISALPAISDLVFMDPEFEKYARGDYYIPPFYYGFQTYGYYSSGKIYFECIDPSKGYVVGWKRGEITDPKCHQDKNYEYK